MMRIEEATHIDIVVKLDPSRTVQFNLFERLAHDIVGLALRRLCGLDDSRFV